MRHVAVSGQDRSQTGKSGEGAVGGQDQDQHRGDLDEVVQRPLTEDGPGDLGNHRFVFPGKDPEVVSQDADAEEHGAQDRGHAGHGHPGVLGLRTLEGCHAVRNRLDAGERRATGGEGAEEQEQRQAFDCRDLSRLRPEGLPG